MITFGGAFRLLRGAVVPLFGVLRFSSVGLGPPFAWNLCPWTALQSLATACVSFYLIFGGVHLSS